MTSTQLLCVQTSLTKWFRRHVSRSFCDWLTDLLSTLRSLGSKHLKVQYVWMSLGFQKLHRFMKIHTWQVLVSLFFAELFLIQTPWRVFRLVEGQVTESEQNYIQTWTRPFQNPSEVDLFYARYNGRHTFLKVTFSHHSYTEYPEVLGTIQILSWQMQHGPFVFCFGLQKFSSRKSPMMVFFFSQVMNFDPNWGL